MQNRRNLLREEIVVVTVVHTSTWCTFCVCGECTFMSVPVCTCVCPDVSACVALYLLSFVYSFMCRRFTV